jgi:CO/xanthine dehydrogenase FAD-binding subunit
VGHFTYVRAHSLAEAVDLLNEPGVRSRPLAGGTDLMVQLRHVSPTFDRLVDVGRVPELRTIEDNGHIIIGAAVTFAELLRNPIILRHVPLLAEACRTIGSVQIRNVATIGGNVGNAAPCADTLPVLACLDAEALLLSAASERRLPVSELVTGPNRTALESGELIRDFSLLPPPPESRCVFLRIGRRQAMVKPRLSLAAIGAKDAAGRVKDIRLCAGAAFARFRRQAEVEALLLGEEASRALFLRASEAMVRLLQAESGGRWSAPYKRQALAALTERALVKVLGGES